MRKKLLKPLPLASLLPDVLKTWTLDKKTLLWALRENWPALLGPSLSRQTIPLALQSGTLRIGVKNSVWANELQMMQPEILAKIKKEFPAAEVRELRFQIVT